MTREEIERWLVGRVAKKAALPPSEVSVEATYDDYGLESVDAIEISGELEELLSRPIEPTILYNFPTIQRLASHLADQLGAAGTIRRDGSPATEPIAIIGIGCRFPGAHGPKAFWRLLVDGEHAINEVPADRWDGPRYFDPDRLAPGKMTTRWGGFLADIDGFDNSFFGISLQEAAAMDPQQRALLEVTWEALEDAGIAPSTLAGSDTGVFLGISHNDFERNQLADPRRVNGHTGMGNALSVAANRISYKLDLHGPSLAIDTACSSSLVAAHLALQSLRQGECTMALVAGANVLLAPEVTIAFSKAGMMAPDGLCKTFGRNANGYVRGEGVGVLVLAPLSKARESGMPIYAAIRGSAVNQDGRTNGLNAPSGAAQEAVLRAAYRSANLDPAIVSYVEAHGTGTRLGDAIEASALGRIVGEGRPAGSPCLIGSVKTNIGHLESAAGVAGLIKAALALNHRLIPPSLHADEPNPDLDLDRLGLRVATTAQPLASEAKIGLSAFGFGGTNCHVVLEAAPSDAFKSRPTGPQLFALSAKTAPGLARAARNLARLAAMAGPDVAAYDFAAALACGRDHHACRRAVVCDTLEELAGRLTQDDGSRAKPGIATRIGFVFPGQGAQYAGMARDLARRFPVFAASLAESDKQCASLLGASLLEIMDRADCLEQTRFAQPALTAVQIALVDHLDSLDLRPDMCVGHSIGEIAAAFTAGALNRSAALRLACERGRAMETPEARGAMLAVRLDPQRLALLVEGNKALCVAAYNGPDSAVVSGPLMDVESFAEHLRGIGVASRRLPTGYAFHTPRLSSAARDFANGLDWLIATRPQRPLFSTVTGARIDEPLGASHWMRGAPGPVLFAQAVEAMAREGADLLVEISPREVLTPLLGWVRNEGGSRVDSVALVRQVSPALSVLRTLGEIYCRNRAFSLQKLFSEPASPVRLPTYAWDRTSDLRAQRLARADFAGEAPQSALSLVGRRLTPADDVPIDLWRCEITSEAFGWLYDGDVGGGVLPAAAMVDMMLRVVRLGGGGDALEDFAIVAPVRLVRGATTTVVLKVEHGPGRCAVELSVKVEGAAGWMTCATARVGPAKPPIALDAPRDQPPLERTAARAFYDDLWSLGRRYGPAFRAIIGLQRGIDEAFGELDVSGLGTDEARRVVGLDCAFQLVATAAPIPASETSIWTPSAAMRITVGPGQRPKFVQAKLAPGAEGGQPIADIVVLDDEQQVVVAVDGARLSARSASGLGPQTCWLYEDRWTSLDFEAAAEPGEGRWLLLPGQDSTASDHVAAQLTASGQSVEVLRLRDAAGGSVLDRSGELLAKLAAERPTWDGVICLWPLDELTAPPGDIDCVCRHADDVRELLRQLAGAVDVGRFWLVTAGAHAVGIDQSVVQPGQAPIWGLAYAAAFELPHLSCARLDVDPSPADAAAHWRLAARLVTSAPSEDQFALRRASCFVRRVVARAPPSADAHLAEGGAYLITGGFDAVSLQLASRLVDRGARDLILVDRRGPDTQARSVLASLEKQSARIVHVLADVGNTAEFEKVAQQAKRLAGGLRGIFHVAGALRDAPAMTIDRGDFNVALRAKVHAAWALHQLGVDCACKVFCLLSSAAAPFGSIRQGADMAASAFLQSLAEWRRQAGLPATCIDWEPLADAGIATQALRTERGATVVGGAGSEPDDSVDMVLRLIAEGASRAVVLPYDLCDLVHLDPAKTGLALFSQLRRNGPEPRLDGGEVRAPRPPVSEPFLAPRSPLESLICGIWERALGLDAVGARDSFFELGGDSVFASQILLQIERRLSVSLNAEKAFAELTVERLALLAEAAILDHIETMTATDVARAIGDVGLAALAAPRLALAESRDAVV